MDGDQGDDAEDVEQRKITRQGLEVQDEEKMQEKKNLTQLMKNLVRGRGSWEDITHFLLSSYKPVLSKHPPILPPLLHLQDYSGLKEQSHTGLVLNGKKEQLTYGKVMDNSELIVINKWKKWGKMNLYICGSQVWRDWIYTTKDVVQQVEPLFFIKF